MKEDHSCLKFLLDNFLKQINDPILSAKIFVEFLDRLTKHFELEEGFVFPRFDLFCGFENNVGPTAIVRKDHQVIKKLLAKINQDNKIGNKSGFNKLCLNLNEVIISHLEREDKIHYPTSKKFITESDWQEAFIKVYGNDFLLRND